MSKYLDLDIKEINKLLKSKKIKPVDLVKEALDNIKSHEEYNNYITINKNAIKEAQELEKREVDNLLFGIPIAIKDNIVTKGMRTTCGSKMLKDYVSLFDATVVEKIKEKGMIIIGKTNMDEFAFGSTSESSFFGKSLNPSDKERVPGGSSGGSASTVGLHDLFCAIGSDTGGSIREPSSFCGTVGMKPTYGRVSRYGLVTFASSFDQIGTITRDVYTNALLLEAISGQDKKDLTSFKKERDFLKNIDKDIKGLKIGIIPSLINCDSMDDTIKKRFYEIVDKLKKKGVSVKEVEIKYLNLSYLLYQILAYGEASSELLKFDGIRYGYHYDETNDINELYVKTREEGFGEEVKRRIMKGTFVLHGENIDKYYKKALRLRKEIQDSFFKAFDDIDLILVPTTSNIAPKLGKGMKVSQSNLNDNLVMGANLGGFPALSLPMGKKDNLPMGIQILGNLYEEGKIYNLAYILEGCINE